MILIGDVHGKYDRYKKITEGLKDTIQVGDMGVGFVSPRSGREMRNPHFDWMVENNHRFIRGNHDNPSVCTRHRQFIPDGTIEDDVMFIGGALSIDKNYRIEGLDYWSDEEISYEKLGYLISIYSEVKPRIMITHECPEYIAHDLNHRRFKLDPMFASRTRIALQNMWEIHKPEIWVFGHWHISWKKDVLGTRFICLNELEMTEI